MSHLKPNRAGLSLSHEVGSPLLHVVDYLSSPPFPVGLRRVSLWFFEHVSPLLPLAFVVVGLVSELPCRGPYFIRDFLCTFLFSIPFIHLSRFTLKMAGNLFWRSHLLLSFFYSFIVAAFLFFLFEHWLPFSYSRLSSNKKTTRL